MDTHVFALDIGTRTVTGILLTKEDHTYTVVDHYVKEHKERSMLDGQIHNVVQVAEVIQDVKDHLEKDGISLHSVYVAAAGRSLKTVQATADIELGDTFLTNEEMIKHLELSAVHHAQLKLVQNDDKNEYHNYHCVGYSVLHYKLDGERIGALIDQQGESASVEVIATFLPKVVVESLIASLKRAGLEMKALTLEPIAAIQVLIPESMRRLNVALVDIGAGTSDIAITDEGTVTAYGMVPIAGDEVTEKLCDTYLLDYPLAERMKCSMKEGEVTSVPDILGFETEISYGEFLQTITPTAKQLTTQIAEEILKLNGKAPKAVMLIGGGSLTPQVTTLLAEKLQLPENRVAVRGVDAIQTVNVGDRLPKGPDFITPIGIAVAAKEKPVHYVSVFVNNRELKMFEMSKLTVGDCLVQAGIHIQKFYGSPGNAYFIHINGEQITLPGSLGGQPKIFLNGERTSVDTFIHDNDVITIEQGERGTEPDVTIKEVLGDIPTKRIHFNGEQYLLEPVFYMNGKEATEARIIPDNAVIEIRECKTLEDFFNQIELDHHKVLRPFIVTVNDKRIELTAGESEPIINGMPATNHSLIQNGDDITLEFGTAPTVEMLLDELNQDITKTIQITFNGNDVTLETEALLIKRLRNESYLKQSDSLISHERLHITEKENAPFIFQDVFRYVDLDLTKVAGRFSLLINDQPAAFDSPIQHKDVLLIRWDQENES